MEKIYSIEELIIDDTFINYCYNANAHDVEKWNAYINSNNQADVEEAKRFVYGLGNMLASSQVNESFRKFKSLTEDISHVTKVKSLWKSIGRIAAAAIIILSVGGGIYLYQHNKKITAEDTKILAEVKPGSNKAILTLANGKRIALEEAKTGLLSNEGGTSVNKTSDGLLKYNDSQNEDSPPSFNKLEIPRGGQYQVVLSDGSKVWLNSASILIYPTSFDTKERKVELIGEAYFEIAKDKTKPFRVVSKEQTVEVLGTHFNISNYPDDMSVHTTLLEGSVRVVAKSTGSTQILKPGGQINISGNSIQIDQHADIEEVIAWKNGDFNFKGEDIKSIMRQLSRWYNIDVRYEGKVTDEVYYAKISRNKNISEVLKLLEQAEGVHFKIQERRIIVMQ
ncbi:hypothetical protein C3K47_05205 [Solitalea longa]|uniref:Anti-sigma factor n=1 Tax=Solitalea longa TaxID=2079460 RepID=A0A2S5A5V9_9SPHI|nr:FecR family protein [Solitalea longa]POY37925.1 hypothetical protein C3K47_05205 [Solitalea longa]